jgi:hypothetical protein
MAREMVGEAITYWKKVFDEQAASELQVVAFCQKSNISKSKYYYWKRRVGNISCKTKDICSGKLKVPEFIEVQNPAFVQKGQNEAFANAVEIRIGLTSLFYRSDTDRDLFKTVVSLLIEVDK